MLIEPNISTIKFATFHLCKLWQLKVPNNFAYGNSLWLTILYTNGELQNIPPKQRGSVLRGEKWEAICKPQIDGKIWLRRIHGVLCGFEEFYDRLVLPSGFEHYYGRIVPEMTILLHKLEGKSSKKIFKEVMEHDFEKLPLMEEVVEKNYRTKQVIDDMVRYYSNKHWKGDARNNAKAIQEAQERENKENIKEDKIKQKGKSKRKLKKKS